MQDLTLAAQTMFAELLQRTLDAEFDDNYDERGIFKKRKKKGRYYWHYVRDIAGKKREEYVGPVTDRSITDRISRFASLKSDFRGRQEMVRALSAAGLPVPDSISGEVIEAMWKAGFFRLRGVLVGTLAYQCYAGLLGVRLGGASLMTQDAWQTAWTAGPRWKEKLESGRARLSDAARTALDGAVEKAAESRKRRRRGGTGDLRR